LEIGALVQPDRFDEREIAGVYDCVAETVASGIAVRTMEQRLGFRTVNDKMNLSKRR
jgi:hypothetical protein